MRYDILGSLKVTDDNGISSVSAPKMKVVLAALLIRANHVVTRDQLIEEVWGAAPPPRATAGVHVYVSQLRKFLGRPGHTDSPIVTSNPGYLLRVEPGNLDLHAFQRLLREGRSAAHSGHYDTAFTALGSALALYRGPALNGPGPIVGGFARWLEEARIECAELFVNAGVERGRYQEMIGMLRSLLAEHPLHEAFYHQLIRCMSLSGRRAEALRTYQAARETIRRELGLEPCLALRELQQSILRAGEERTGMRLVV